MHAPHCAAVGSSKTLIMLLSHQYHFWQVRLMPMSFGMTEHLRGGAGMEGDGGDEVQGDNEVRLRHALDPRTRRWARAEFFCSALDRPWLADNGVQTLCNHFGLKVGQLGRLSRTEWTCIRRSLGRPRRLSLAFLRQVCLLSYILSSAVRGWATQLHRAGSATQGQLSHIELACLHRSKLPTSS